MASKAATVKADISQVLARLNKIKATGASVQPALAAFGGAILNRIRLGFRLGRSPWGASWHQLLIRKGGAPLRDTGRLMRSITMQQGRNAVTIGTNLRQARVHQFGATIKPKNASVLRFPGPNGFIFARQVTIPARPFMPITQAGEASIPTAWANSGLNAMKRALQL